MHRRLWRPVRAAAAAVAGAVAAYFLDPEQGRTRRSRTADQAAATLRRTGRQASRRLRYIAGRGRGVAARGVGAGRSSPEDDVQVAEGVRMRLSGLQFPTSDVTVEVVGGVARLRGEVPTSEAQQQLEAEVSGAPGVREVESYVHLPGEPPPNKASALRAS